MVIRSLACFNAAKRIPMIKFRKGGGSGGQTQASAPSVSSQSPATPPQASPPPKTKPTPTPQPSCGTSQGLAIEDWQLPPRYRRKAFSEEEIEYINRGGPDKA